MIFVFIVISNISSVSLQFGLAAIKNSVRLYGVKRLTLWCCFDSLADVLMKCCG